MRQTVAEVVPRQTSLPKTAASMRPKPQPNSEVRQTPVTSRHAPPECKHRVERIAPQQATGRKGGSRWLNPSIGPWLRHWPSCWAEGIVMWSF